MIGSFLFSASVVMAAGPAPAPATATAPSAVLKRLADPVFVRRVLEVRLTGSTDPLGPEPGRRVEETGIWPDRYERRSVPGNGWLRLSTAAFLTPTRVPGSDGIATRSFGVARLRSLFVLKHLADAVASRRLVRPATLGGHSMAAVEVSDHYGRFRIIWGGPAKSLQGIEMGRERIYFPAFARTGPWMYPAVQSYERDGVVREILRVTKTSTRPTNH